MCEKNKIRIFYKNNTYNKLIKKKLFHWLYIKYYSRSMSKKKSVWMKLASKCILNNSVLLWKY